MSKPLASIFHWLVEWGVGGGVAGVVAGIMPVGCDGLPRVVSRWSGLSGDQGCSFRVVVDRRQEPCVYGAGRAWRCPRPSSRRLVQGWQAL